MPKSNRHLNVWIDLASAPQVQLYRPIIHELQRRGHSVTTTTRSFSETIALADLYGIKHRVVGSHGGRSSTGKLVAVLGRAFQLAVIAKREKVDLALGHNSHAQSLAAGFLRIPLVIMTDYEYQPAHHLSLRFARRVLVPESVDAVDLTHYGIPLERVERYHGIKEDIYLADFVPTRSFRHDLNIPGNDLLVVMRPPATMSAYHRFANPLFDQALDFVVRKEGISLLLFPRTEEQANYARRLGLSNIHIPERALDGPNAIYWADLVISAGGTMNREAATLGTPAYTVYGGRIGGVDRSLISQGKLVRIKEENELERIQLKPKQNWFNAFGQPGLLTQIVDRVLDAVG